MGGKTEPFSGSAVATAKLLNVVSYFLSGSFPCSGAFSLLLS
jgi:hypothetical protein